MKATNDTKMDPAAIQAAEMAMEWERAHPGKTPEEMIKSFLAWTALVAALVMIAIVIAVAFAAGYWFGKR